MSRYYGMTVTISGYNVQGVEAIRAAAAEEWPFEAWTDSGDQLTAYAESNLCGGETEEQFTERLSVAVWRANGAYCEVSVDASYLESLPYETHSLNEDYYDRLVGSQPTDPPSTKDQQHA